MDDCIIWPKSKTTAGYGQLKRNGKKVMAHRVAWEENFGAIPTGLSVCHKCDNPPCVNINHLFLGTHGDNIKDCYAKKRRVPPSKPAVTEFTAVKIKMLDGIISYRQIANILKVSASYVGNIAKGKRFNHVVAKTRYSF